MTGKKSPEARTKEVRAGMNTEDVRMPLFELGPVVIGSAAKEVLAVEGTKLSEILAAHQTGVWGCADLAEENLDAIAHGEGSVYTPLQGCLAVETVDVLTEISPKGSNVTIVTAGERPPTTILNYS